MNESDPGHGNSPVAWTAVVIMTIAFAVGTVAFFFSIIWLVLASAGLVIVGILTGWVLARLGFGVGGSRLPAKDIISMLADLVAGARRDAAARRQARDLAQVEATAHARPAAIDARLALMPRDTVHIIAEIKRASPSRGVLADIPDPAALASAYQSGGASAISVLTEGRKFGGSLTDLENVRDAVTLPVLRKDFIVEPYQVLEARASGADLVLLIVAALPQSDLSELFALISELGMTALVETHSSDEVIRALDIGAEVIGVNARDLSTFELDQNLFARLADSIPSGVIRVAESAVKTADDVAHYRRSGADAVLVGEALVTGDPISTLRDFLAA